MEATLVVALTALLGLVVYLVRRGALEGALADQRNEALRVERDRVAALESAAAAARAARAVEFDEKARAATTPAAAADLLSSQLRGDGTH